MRRSRLSFVVALVVAVVVAVAALAACGGEEEASAPERESAVPSVIPTRTGRNLDHPAAASVRDQYALEAAGQWDRHWERLHPAYQARAPKELYTTCNASRNLRLSVKVLDAYPASINVAGTLTRDAMAVTIEITGNIGPGGQEQVVVRTVHQVPVDGGWRWIMSEAALAAFRQGNCL